jgi:NAD(P)-dependent dehydrogenase (short-subunit alcohol dehydrogenase family)
LLARLGAKVVLSGPDRAESDREAALLRATGATAIAADGDVTDPDQVAALAETTAHEFGGVDVWVNNAAFDTPGMARTLEFDPAVVPGVTAVNILGTYYGTRTALEVMVRQGRGLLVNVTGRGDDVRPAKYSSAYAASKAWIRSFTRTVAAEYADSGVHVVAFNPGMMTTGRLSTEATDSVRADERTMRLYEFVTRVMADPPEIAARRLAQLVADAQEGRAPREVRLITPARVVRGLLAEGTRAARLGA